MRRALLALVLLALPFAARAAGDAPIAWRDFSPDRFAEARREGKLVLLDMEAVWCHWCHVMDATTYRDPEVVALIARHVVPIKVDQDSHPGLSQRYEDWGWPATIVFDGEGRELLKARGYIEPAQMRAALAALVANPTPLDVPPPTRAGARGHLGDDQRAMLGRRFLDAFDDEQAGWGGGHKFLQPDAIEWALALGLAGDAVQRQRALATLAHARALIDPVDGGMYQYSDNGRWDSPHYEKIMSSQAGAVRLYALAFALTGDAAHRDAALAIDRYLDRFLRDPSGAYRVSQDADLRDGAGRTVMTGKQYYALDAAGRRAAGQPRIDASLYARETGWAVSALVALAEATGDDATLDRAVRSARWIVAERGGPGGGVRHGAEGEDRFLQTNLAAGAAFLDLYRATADRRWLDRAAAVGRFMIDRIEDRADGGFPAAPPPAGAVGALAIAAKHLDDNAAAARFLNLLRHYTGDAAFGAAATRTMAWLAAHPAANRPAFWPSLLQADRELADEPTHVTVVGPRDDPATRALHRAALAYPAIYRRIEIHDPASGPLPNMDVEYPDVGAPALFACTGKICSLPVFEPAQARAALDRLLRPVAGR
ncbi:MAG: DUF255 domain-containing protein [Alphaproteobacteria bacterium]